MIEVKNLTKHYGDKKAVNDISFVVNDGEILGFLGPNGAGKSTTMNMLTGYISSTSGNVLINGIDILENPIKAKANIGYLPEIPPLYIDMTVKAYLNFVYDLKKCKLPRRDHLEGICKLCKVDDVKNRIIKHLSKGYKQRVGLAQALIGNPPVLILDEPSVGLDPEQMVEIRNLIKKLGSSHTVILSSHILSEIQEICDRVIIINKGEIAADGTTDNLSKQISDASCALKVQLEGDKNSIMEKLEGIGGKNAVRVKGVRKTEEGVYEYTIEPKDGGTDLRREVSRLINENNWTVLSMKSDEMTLENIFLKITMGEGVSAAEKNSDGGEN